jgi:hypothetical protein
VLNLDAARKCRVPLFAPGDPACANGVGDIRNVRCSGFRVHRSAPHAANPLIDVLTRVDNFIIEDFRRDEAADANPAVPTLHMAEIPATRVECEGLSAAQIAALQARSSALREGAWRMLAPGAEPRFRASLRTEMGTCVTLPNGGFDRLSLSRNI